MNFLPRGHGQTLLKRVLAAVFSWVIWASCAQAQNDAEWIEPFPPFRIAGELYYVGSKGLASYLVATPQGHIMINCGLEANVPMIRASVERLGFKFSDIKILLISHAHWDHCGGGALFKQLTGAEYLVMEADVPVVESGGRADFQYANFQPAQFSPTKVDRVLHDGDEVRLGDAVLVAHLTPGHTPGCTTWTMNLPAGNRQYNVVIVGSPNVNEGYKLVDNPRYPRITADYERTFQVLKGLPCDLFLGAHGNYFGMLAKYAQMLSGTLTPFVDPVGYQKYVAQTEEAFHRELAKQEAARQQPAAH